MTDELKDLFSSESEGEIDAFLAHCDTIIESCNSNNTMIESCNSNNNRNNNPSITSHNRSNLSNNRKRKRKDHVSKSITSKRSKNNNTNNIGFIRNMNESINRRRHNSNSIGIGNRYNYNHIDDMDDIKWDIIDHTNGQNTNKKSKKKQKTMRNYSHNIHQPSIHKRKHKIPNSTQRSNSRQRNNNNNYSLYNRNDVSHVGWPSFSGSNSNSNNNNNNKQSNNNLNYLPPLKKPKKKIKPYFKHINGNRNNNNKPGNIHNRIASLKQTLNGSHINNTSLLLPTSDTINPTSNINKRRSIHKETVSNERENEYINTHKPKSISIDNINNNINNTNTNVSDKPNTNERTNSTSYDTDRIIKAIGDVEQSLVKRISNVEKSVKVMNENINEIQQNNEDDCEENKLDMLPNERIERIKKNKWKWNGIKYVAQSMNNLSMRYNISIQGTCYEGIPIHNDGIANKNEKFLKILKSNTNNVLFHFVIAGQEIMEHKRSIPCLNRQCSILVLKPKTNYFFYRLEWDLDVDKFDLYGNPTIQAYRNNEWTMYTFYYPTAEGRNGLRVIKGETNEVLQSDLKYVGFLFMKRKCR